MRSLAQKQNQRRVSSGPARPHIKEPASDHREHPILHLQRTIGNQAVLGMLQLDAERGSAGTASPRFDIPIHAAVAGAIQPKLAINMPGDKYEQEADRVADQVMRMPEARLQRACPLGAERPADRIAQPSRADEQVQPHDRVGSGDSGQPARQPIIDEVLRSPGRPLDPATRRFMEPRFGYDFRHVRVHRDTQATQSARCIYAKAYTAGPHIVFDSNYYSPDTATGRHLLAHELSHLVQQQGGKHLILRKEVYQRVARANRGSVAPGDWLDVDRQEWEMASLHGFESSLSPTNTFMRAVYYNTQHFRPKEYKTVRERHDYYDLISYVLERDRNTPAALKGIRFFRSATAVTGTPGIGSVDTIVGAGKLEEQTRQVLQEVNEELFALNMGVIRELLFNWREPRSPRNPTAKAIGSFEFDLRMVETEQKAVEDYIQRNPQLFTGSVKQDINDTLDPSAFGQFFNFSRRSFEWARDALQVRSLDFTNIKHRKAIGFAAVHIFHRKSYKDYEFFLAAYHVLP
jgi:hypothetical protein